MINAGDAITTPAAEARDAEAKIGDACKVGFLPWSYRNTRSPGILDAPSSFTCKPRAFEFVECRTGTSTGKRDTDATFGYSGWRGRSTGCHQETQDRDNVRTVYVLVVDATKQRYPNLRVSTISQCRGFFFSNAGSSSKHLLGDVVDMDDINATTPTPSFVVHLQSPTRSLTSELLVPDDTTHWTY